MTERDRHSPEEAGGETLFTIEQLAGICARDGDWVRLRLTEGMLPAAPHGSGQVRFSAAALRRARRMAAIERDFDAVPELAALMADLLDELDRLRGRLRSHGLE
ncbi:MAG: MerR family transcriptional regulator [Rhodocyclaceae bacterium]|nr:MerR family transcriptional regulator [Rhodocyclaceae bacterium]